MPDWQGEVWTLKIDEDLLIGPCGYLDRFCFFLIFFVCLFVFPLPGVLPAWCSPVCFNVTLTFPSASVIESAQTKYGASF